MAARSMMEGDPKSNQVVEWYKANALFAGLASCRVFSEEHLRHSLAVELPFLSDLAHLFLGLFLEVLERKSLRGEKKKKALSQVCTCLNL